VKKKVLESEGEGGVIGHAEKVTFIIRSHAKEGGPYFRESIQPKNGI